MAGWIRFCCSCLLGLLASAPAIAGTDASLWPTFDSPAGFSVRYPGNWFIIEGSEKYLTILSDERREEGAIIAPGEQMIDVMEDVPRLHDENISVYQEVERGDLVLHHELIEQKNAPENGCGNFFVYRLKTEYGDRIYQISTVIVCKIRTRVFRSYVTQWADDPYSQTAYEVVLAMMHSLRADPNRPALKN